MSQRPLISVCLITYNHEKYIRKAIEGVLQQQTEFSFELIIAEDCSTDNTRKIVQEYADKFPTTIRLILQQKNVGPADNFIDLLKSANGKYVAYFEGDDYWTDYRKLQKQVEFLENHPEFVLVFHNVNIVSNEEKFINKIYPENRKKVIKFIDLVKGDYTKTCASVFRNDRDKLRPIFGKVIEPHDTSLYLLLLDGSSAYYFEDTMAAYRIHDGGIWSAKKKVYQLEYSINFLKEMISYYKSYPEVKYFKQQLNSVYIGLASEYYSVRNYRDWFKYTIKCISSPTWTNKKIYFDSVKSWIRNFRFRGAYAAKN
jgi:glycosyltransferase involved in cell wall biosynthesis